MKKVKFILPVVALTIAVAGAFATNVWANKGVVLLDSVSCSVGSCTQVGICSGTGSTCEIGGCGVTFLKTSGLNPCTVPALGTFTGI